MPQTDSISITPELSASAQKSRAGKLNCCEHSGSQMQGGQLSMTCFCEQETLNMKENMQGFWLCVFMSYGNAFSSQHWSKAGIWCTPIKRCSVIITVSNGEQYLEEKTLLLFLCFVRVLMVVLSSRAWNMHRLCLFLPFAQQSCSFSLVCQKTYLWLSIPKATTPIKPYCLIAVISFGFWPSPQWYHLLPFHRGCRLWSLSQPSALQF